MSAAEPTLKQLEALYLLATPCYETCGNNIIAKYPEEMAILGRELHVILDSLFKEIVVEGK